MPAKVKMLTDKERGETWLLNWRHSPAVLLGKLGTFIFSPLEMLTFSMKAVLSEEGKNINIVKIYVLGEGF